MFGGQIVTEVEQDVVVRPRRRAAADDDRSFRGERRVGHDVRDEGELIEGPQQLVEAAREARVRYPHGQPPTGVAGALCDAAGGGEPVGVL